MVQYGIRKGKKTKEYLYKTEKGVELPVKLEVKQKNTKKYRSLAHSTKGLPRPALVLGLLALRPPLPRPADGAIALETQGSFFVSDSPVDGPASRSCSRAYHCASSTCAVEPYFLNPN